MSGQQNWVLVAVIGQDVRPYEQHRGEAHLPVRVGVKIALLKPSTGAVLHISHEVTQRRVDAADAVDLWGRRARKLEDDACTLDGILR